MAKVSIKEAEDIIQRIAAKLTAGASDKEIMQEQGKQIKP
jgi:hypothetical protein